MVGVFLFLIACSCVLAGLGAIASAALAERHRRHPAHWSIPPAGARPSDWHPSQAGNCPLSGEMPDSGLVAEIEEWLDRQR